MYVRVVVVRVDVVGVYDDDDVGHVDGLRSFIAGGCGGVDVCIGVAVVIVVYVGVFDVVDMGDAVCGVVVAYGVVDVDMDGHVGVLIIVVACGVCVM